LHVVEDERNKLHFWLFALIPRGIGLASLNGTANATAAEQGKKITFEYQAQHQQDEEAANPDVHPAKVEASSSTAAFVSTVFEVVAAPTRRPTHDFSPPLTVFENRGKQA